MKAPFFPVNNLTREIHKKEFCDEYHNKDYIQYLEVQKKFNGYYYEFEKKIIKNEDSEEEIINHDEVFEELNRDKSSNYDSKTLINR